MKKKSTVIIILGMHRSGTSVLSGVLNKLGVEMGTNLMPPRNDNEKGFWENVEVVELNEEILSYLGSAYDDVKPLPDKWWLGEDMIKYQEKIFLLIKKEFLKYKIWGIKDPRFCRLVPLWDLVIKQLKIESCYVLAFRNPLEVANSLYQRDGTHKSISLLLWLRYNLEAEYYPRGKNRVFVSYKDFLENWNQVINKICQTLKLDNLIFSDSKIAEIEAFISESLYHQKLSEKNLLNDKYFNDWISKTYSFFQQSSKLDSEIDNHEIISVKNAINSMDVFIWDLINEQTNTAINKLKSQQLDILNSWSWRLTYPLRKIKKISTKYIDY